MTKYSILINTCDKFEDCWNPFFKLFKLYWPDCSGIIYLNTEYKDYSYPGLNIIPVKGCVKHQIPHNKRATWSQCLKWALEEMDTDIVLYMQEDYFLNGKVDSVMFNHFLEIIDSHKEIPCIQLTNGGFPEVLPSETNHLSYGDTNHYAYVSCQASLWRKNVLKSLIREYESAWNFEWYGSQRAKYLNLKFLTVSSSLVKAGGYEIIPYLMTGVIGGKWYRPTVDLFVKHNIPMDFNIRGFHDEIQLPLFERMKRKWNFIKIKSILEILLLKIKRLFLL
jgi:hypothetical protein